MAKKKSSKKWIWIIILLIIASGLVYQFALKKEDTTITVTTEKVGRRTITQTVSAIGKIQPETEIKISPEVSGEIIFLGVQEGDTVTKGQLLVRINPDIIETQLEQQRTSANATKMEIDVRKAELTRAEADLERIKELYDKEFASKQELDQATAAFQAASGSYQSTLQRYQTALAALSQVERNALRTTIYSPINGIVSALDVELGEKVVGTEMMQGTEMMKIADLSIMNAVVDVDENDITLVEIGDTTNIEIDAIPNRIFKGKVIEIAHSATVSAMGSQDQVTNFEVKVRLLENESKLRPGMSSKVDIITEVSENVVSVPLQAVTVRTAKELNKNPDINNTSGPIKNNQSADRMSNRPPSVIFMKEGDKAVMKQVETGISDKGFIEVMSGVEEGSEIISGSFTAVSTLLFDGAIVKVDTTSQQRSFGK